jgi:DNA-binding transcriptional LysR family regulator
MKFSSSLDATPEQMRALCATVETGSFTAAARALRKTQSAVSQNIAALEAALGLELFDRTGYRPVLTSAGARVHEIARRIVGQVEELAGLARALGAGYEAELSVAIDEFFPMRRAVRALRAVRERFPRTKLLVRTGALGEVAEMVISGLASFGISGPLEKEPDTFVRTPLTAVGLVPVVSRAHPLANVSSPIPLEALRPHVQVVLTDRSPYTEGIRRGVVDSEHCLAGSLSAKRAFLLGGLGWGTMPRHLIQADLRRGALVRIRPEGWADGDYSVRLDALHPRHTPPGPVCAWLLERLKASMPEMPINQG